MTIEDKEKIARLMACRLKGHKIVLAGGISMDTPLCVTCLFNSPIYNNPKDLNLYHFEPHFNCKCTNAKDCNENRKKE